MHVCYSITVRPHLGQQHHLLPLRLHAAAEVALAQLDGRGAAPVGAVVVAQVEVGEAREHHAGEDVVARLEVVAVRRHQVVRNRHAHGQRQRGAVAPHADLGWAGQGCRGDV